MPELPDVEFMRRRLERSLLGATIVAARSADPLVLRPASPRTFSRALAGRTVREVTRRGKWLRLLLDDGSRLFSHLGMTGWWIDTPPDSPSERSERAWLDVVRDGRPRRLRYLDSRRFGRLLAAKKDIAEWRALGPDPLDEGIRVDRLVEALSRRRRAVKDAIMDQTILAGIGNILATEALWHARIDPRSRSDALSRSDVASVVRGIRTAVRRQLATRERTEASDFDDVFQAYGRKGSPCRRCGSLIARVVLGGRGTAFCRVCQVRRTRRTGARSASESKPA